jgi:hypothetical protein
MRSRVRLRRARSRGEAETDCGKRRRGACRWRPGEGATLGKRLTTPACQSRQHERIRTAVTGLTQRIEATPSARQIAPAEGGWWRRGGAAIVSIAVLLIGKLKFLLLGLTKATTFLSMFAFFGVYWSVYGWPLALGIVISIYIHEMGHVAMLRRPGIAAGAPILIPGVGAFVMLKQPVDDPVTDQDRTRRSGLGTRYRSSRWALRGTQARSGSRSRTLRLPQPVQPHPGLLGRLARFCAVALGDGSWSLRSA